MNKARTPTGLAALIWEASVMPSKLVTFWVMGAPGKAWTRNVPVGLKKDGTPVRLNVLGVKGATGVAVKRDQRRVTVSEVDEGGVVAVKVLTWTAIVCPGRRGVVSVAP